MKICFVDTETRCAVPIERGNSLYTRSAQCIIVTWAVDEEPALGWDLLDPLGDRWPAQLEDAVLDDRVTLVAHNVPFDRNIFRFSLKRDIPLHRWWCTRAQAYAHGYPGALDTLGLVLGLKEDQRKLDDGKKLIQKFCVPRADGKFREPTDFPEDWERFFQYAVRDTEALREIYKRLPKHNYL